MSRTSSTQAVVLRSIRYGEADRILHLYTLAEGRVGAIAKGARRTKSRFGARLEPLSHVDIQLHRGGGELRTVTGVDLVASHHAAREHAHPLSVGLIGLEAMLRLFPEQEANERAFQALTRFLDALDVHEGAGRPELDPLGLAFQLKLVWVAGYLPHVSSCAECGATEGLAGFSARAGGTVCRACAAGALALSPDGLAGFEGLIRRPLAQASDAGLTERGARDVLAMVTSTYEEHGHFRMRTLAAT